MREISQGSRTGECAPGDGCRAVLSHPERLRRWWLNLCGVNDRRIRAAGGAVPFVLEFGMPDLPRCAVNKSVNISRPGVRVAAIREPRSKLPVFCFDEADGDPELALWLAVEIVGRGVSVAQLVTVDAVPELAA